MDVGAQIGLITKHMRDYAKIVYAIEPSSEHYAALDKNVKYNEWDNVKTFNMAIADRDGEMSLNSNTQNRTCHSLQLNYQQGSEMVKTQTFATFMKENKIKKVDFCKFDVEGAEDMILRSEGFTSVAHKIKSIMVEFHFPTWNELVKHMIGLGYTARLYPCSAKIVLFDRK